MYRKQSQNHTKNARKPIHCCEKKMMQIRENGWYIEVQFWSVVISKILKFYLNYIVI